MEILGIIIARGGSKGVPRKNVRILKGRPLLAYTVEAGLKSKMISRLILSSNDDEIINVGSECGVEVPFIRPEEISKDDTPGLPVIQHAVSFLKNKEGYEPNVIVVLQPTSPLRNSKHIDESLEVFLNSGADSMVSVTELEHNMNPYSVMRLDDKGLVHPFLKYDERKNLRQKKPIFYGRNGAIYACTYSCLMNFDSLYGESTAPYFMKKRESFDIDDQVDWEIIESLFDKQ